MLGATVRRVGRGVALVVALAAVIAAATASAADPGPTQYCVGHGGPLGIATDAEHTVLIGDPPLPAGVRTGRVSVGGVSTRVQQAGPPNAQEAIVFVHGSPDSSRDWDQLLAASGHFARAVAFDIPGYGKSDKVAPQIQTTDGAAGYIAGVLDKLGIKRAVLVVHDFGGTWGLQWAVKHTHALLGAVLIDTGVLIDYVPHPVAVVYSTPGAGELEMASTTRANWHVEFRTHNPPSMPDSYIDRLYDYFDRPERCAVLRYYRSASQNFMTLGRDQAKVLKPLNLPALVIWGKQDPYVPVDQAQKQKEAFPRARIAILDGSAHWPHIDNPKRVRELAIPFLRPKLSATLGRVSAHSVSVRVHVTGMLPAYRVTASLGGVSSTPTKVAGKRTLVIRLRNPLAAGVHVVKVRALGLPSRSLRLKVARRRTTSGRHGQQDPEDR
jgi:pimeloyl-ACP methyl ester carboxylesterase